MPIYRQYIFSDHRQFNKIKYILNHKVVLKFKLTEVIQSVFPAHKSIKISERKSRGRSVTTWELKNSTNNLCGKNEGLNPHIKIKLYLALSMWTETQASGLAEGPHFCGLGEGTTPGDVPGESQAAKGRAWMGSHRLSQGLLSQASARLPPGSIPFPPHYRLAES